MQPSTRNARSEGLILPIKQMPGVWFPTCEELVTYCLDKCNEVVKIGP